MSEIVKNVSNLMPDDLSAHPVWAFALEMESVDDLAVRPVTALPVDDLANCVVGTRVRLANGTKLWAKMLNVKLDSPAETRQFLAASILVNNAWVYLARPQDFNQKDFGPMALADRLGLAMSQVFPISYDISNCCVGVEGAIRGTIDYGR